MAKDEQKSKYVDQHKLMAMGEKITGEKHGGMMKKGGTVKAKAHKKAEHKKKK